TQLKKPRREQRGEQDYQRYIASAGKLQRQQTNNDRREVNEKRAQQPGCRWAWPSDAINRGQQINVDWIFVFTEGAKEKGKRFAVLVSAGLRNQVSVERNRRLVDVITRRVMADAGNVKDGGENKDRRQQQHPAATAVTQ